MTFTTRIYTLFDICWSGIHSLTALRMLPHVCQKFVLPCCDLGAILGRVILASDILDYTFRINRNMTFVYFYSFYLFQHFHQRELCFPLAVVRCAWSGHGHIF